MKISFLSIPILGRELFFEFLLPVFTFISIPGLFYVLLFNTSFFLPYLSVWPEERLVYLILGAFGGGYIFWRILKDKIYNYINYLHVFGHSLQAALLAIAIICFIVPLIQAWTTNLSNGEGHISGYLPWSDAYNYLCGAVDLLESGKLDVWNQRRPLTAIFFTTLLFITNYNFSVALILQGTIMGAVAYSASREISRDFGPWAGIFLFCFLYGFGSHYLHTTLSESLGLILGTIAFIFLWRGIRQEKKGITAIGMGFLSLALITRAGPFLLLPMLSMGIGFYFRKKLEFWSAFFYCTIAVIAGFGIQFFILKIYGTGENIPFSNFSSTIYGIVQGGKGWGQAYNDFSSLGLSEGALAKHIYKKSLEVFIHSPHQLVYGLLKGYWDYYQQHTIRLFGVNVFMGFIPTGSGLASILSTVGLPFALVLFLTDRKYRPLGQLLLFAWIGIVLSLPFIFTDGGRRVLASAVPIMAVPGALGIAFAVSKWCLGFPLPKVPLSESSKRTIAQPLLIISLFVLLFSFFLPLIFTGFNKKPVVSRFYALEGKLIRKIEKGSFNLYLRIIPDNRISYSFAPLVRIGDFLGTKMNSLDIGTLYDDVKENNEIIFGRNQMNQLGYFIKTQKE